MNHNRPEGGGPQGDTAQAPSFHAAWEDHRGYLLGLATRMLGDRSEAEDVTQEAFSRLAQLPLQEIDDVRGWLAVVVRRLCLDRLRSAYSRRESASGSGIDDDQRARPGGDPADRVTLDEQVRLALGVVLDRLTPAERTAFVLHDVFGFPFEAVGQIVGRTAVACRQLASRARRSIRSEPPLAPAAGSAGSDALTERFIAACDGGDLNALMTLLDPHVDGHAVLVGRGTLAQLDGRLIVARRLLTLFGPASDRTLVPFPIENRPGVASFDRSGLNAVIVLHEQGGVVAHIEAFLLELRRSRPQPAASVTEPN